MRKYFKELTEEQKRELCNVMDINVYPYGFGQGTTVSNRKDGSILYYSYNHNVNYHKAAFFKDFDVRITSSGKKELFSELPPNKAHIIKYFKYMLSVYGKEYYMYAAAYWSNNDKMLALLYRAHKNLTEKELDAML